MRCETNPPRRSLAGNRRAWRRHALISRLTLLAVMLLAALTSACAEGSGNNLPPKSASEWFFVDSFTGEVGGFSAASGRLEQIPGSSLNFSTSSGTPLPFFSIAVDPEGMFVTGITTNSAGNPTLQIASIASGGAISLTQLTATTLNPLALTISPQGVIAISDGVSIQFFTLQNNALVAGPTQQTSANPEELAFGPGGKVLYALNAGSTISVISVASDLSLQLIQNASPPLAPGQLGGGLTRIRLNAAGNKIAATTFDGWLYVGDVNPADGTISGITEILVAQNANLQELVLDPTGRNVYANDQDNGGIYEFSTAGGNLATLAGSPIATLPGPVGMEFNSAGDSLYAVFGAGFPQPQIVTYKREPSNGTLTTTGDSVSAGVIFANRMVRVAAH